MRSKTIFFMAGDSTPIPPAVPSPPDLVTPTGRSEMGCPSHADLVAEVDGNRTRRTGIARPTRFEGGGAHQVPGHLRRAP